MSTKKLRLSLAKKIAFIASVRIQRKFEISYKPHLVDAIHTTKLDMRFESEKTLFFHPQKEFT